ncbi:MAG: proline dehydrogenase family protein, partial [Candidatus Caenarcaniphilales bacterium]|nr:proline dehydrogenase family protein [Candidatus Caenarcaniphilales bacterium]
MQTISSINSQLQKQIIHKSFEIYRLCKRFDLENIFNKNFWSTSVMALCIQTPFLKSRIFNFVDVLPALKTEKQLQEHLEAYFFDYKNFASQFLKSSLKLAFQNSFSSKFISNFIQHSSRAMGRTFIAGADLDEVLPILKGMRENNLAFTLDLLGEATLTEKEAQENLEKHIQVVQELDKRIQNWSSSQLLDFAGKDQNFSIPKINLSVKLSSLYSQINLANFEQVKEILKDRLRPLLREAKNKNAFLNIDMEDCEMKDLTLTVFTSILEEPEFIDFKNIGIVIQAYLRSSKSDLLGLVEWCKANNRSVQVRLVKGAYWDYEVIKAKQNGWEIPVFTSKESTDYNYEKLSRILLQNWQYTRPAFGSHNIRSIAHAITLAQALEVPKEVLEFQMLYGMANPLKESLVSLGFRCRDYVPMGELIPGMAYFVRRLMENTSNQSFLTLQNFAKASPKVLLKPPKLRNQSVDFLKFSNSKETFSNFPPADFTKEVQRKSCQDALQAVEKSISQDLEIPIIINGKKIKTERFLNSLNPCQPSQVVARACMASVEHAEEALKCAEAFKKEWASCPIEERAQILLKAADILETRRFEFCAWESLEVAKPWKEADGDIAEAIDFCRYYALEALKLVKGKQLLKVPGEDNQYLYRPKGVGVVIAPWNFPLAIPLGMVVAGLVMGNPIVFKPAEQSTMIGYLLYESLIKAGCPKEALHFLPGSGEEIGPTLVESNKTAFVAFTGSAEVGLSILESANKKTASMKTVKKVISEMGGKNALIVDEDADLDDAIKGVIYSSFGFQGQKCSAL